MKKTIYIYGAGGLGREVLSLIAALPEWKVDAFLDDEPGSSDVHGVPVLQASDFFSRLDEDIFLTIAVGDPILKQTITERLPKKLIVYPTLIHPTAVLQDATRIEIGEGSIIAAGAMLTTDIIVGSHVLINLNSTIGHDSIIGNYCSIMPGVNLAGGVRVGSATLIGAGANVRNEVSVGTRAVIGMGSVVLKNVRDNDTVVGVPAKSIVK